MTAQWRPKILLIAGLICAALGLGVYLFMFRAPGSPIPAQVQHQAAIEPPEVGFIVVHPAETPFPVEYAGRVAGFRDVEVRPRVSGLLLNRDYDEGAEVKQDQVLFQIDPAAYQVAQSRAEAQLFQAQATLRQAEGEFGRIAELFRRGVSATKQRDQAVADRDQASARVKLVLSQDFARLGLVYESLAPLKV